MVLKRKKLAALACATATVALAASACSSSKSTAGSSSSSSAAGGGNVTVWLMTDAQSGWPTAVSGANTAYQTAHPGSKVTVDYQTWPTYLQKFEAAVKAGTVPDVIEFGNTDTVAPMAGGSLTDLSSVSSSFPNYSSWNGGLKSSCTYGGKTYCVPYYAADRMVGLNSKLATAAGITSAPTDWATLLSDIQKLNAANTATKGFTGMEVDAGYEYLAMAFVEDAGGQIGTQDSSGKWQMQFESTADQAGLANFFKLFAASPNNSKTLNENKQDTAFDNQTAAMMYGLSWEFAAPKGTTLPTVNYFNIPSPTKAGSFLPDFTGGSDLAVPSAAKNAAGGEEWLKDYTGNANETIMAQAGVIPNANALNSAITSTTSQVFAKGQDTPYFTPAAQNWALINGTNNYIENMLEAIAQAGGTPASIASNTKSFDAQMDTILNQ
jgi:N,N'-diacetylchitobiose transport system substrate-binding protein